MLELHEGAAVLTVGISNKLINCKTTIVSKLYTYSSYMGLTVKRWFYSWYIADLFW